jgi:ABC-type multidrug transport system fused ATPase/permease subunit
VTQDAQLFSGTIKTIYLLPDATDEKSTMYYKKSACQNLLLQQKMSLNTTIGEGELKYLAEKTTPFNCTCFTKKTSIVII